MRLLLITQSVDKNNPVLSFMHRWIEVFSTQFENIVVICLEKGEYNLPSNVKVLSLGKETGKSRIKYIFNFLRYIVRFRKEYDRVLVHMNQEYVLLGWKWWFLLRKNIYMWRNHHQGNFLTDLAAFFCTKVFCTSKFSYTAKYKKTVIMPVGVDLERFKIQDSRFKIQDSILFLGRIAPTKKPDLLLDALSSIKEIPWHLTIVGDALPKDEMYYQGLKEKAKNLESQIEFKAGVPNTKTPELYSSHEVFVNLSSSGMYDKTIFEAMACGALVLASNENLRGSVPPEFIFKEGDKAELVSKLSHILQMEESEKNKARELFRQFSETHSLTTLAKKLQEEIG